MGFLSNCTVASYNRAEKSNELDFWRSNFLTVKCLNFRTVSPCEGVKETHERKNFKQVEKLAGAFKICFFLVWVFYLIVLLYRITQITELKNARSSILWRSNFSTPKCLNFCTVSPYKGVKERMNARILN